MGREEGDGGERDMSSGKRGGEEGVEGWGYEVGGKGWGCLGKGVVGWCSGVGVGGSSYGGGFRLRSLEGRCRAMWERWYVGWA